MQLMKSLLGARK